MGRVKQNLIPCHKKAGGIAGESWCGSVSGETLVLLPSCYFWFCNADICELEIRTLGITFLLYFWPVV